MNIEEEMSNDSRSSSDKDDQQRPNKPTKHTLYQVYKSEHYNELKANNQGMSDAEISKLIRKNIKKLSEKDTNELQKKVDDLNKNYDEEIAEFNKLTGAKYKPLPKSKTLIVPYNPFVEEAFYRLQLYTEEFRMLNNQ